MKVKDVDDYDENRRLNVSVHHAYMFQNFNFLVHPFVRFAIHNRTSHGGCTDRRTYLPA